MRKSPEQATPQAFLLQTNRPTFQGEDAAFYEILSRKISPISVVGTSIHECYQLAVPQGSQFVEVEIEPQLIEFYERTLMRVAGFEPKIVDEETFQLMKKL